MSIIKLIGDAPNQVSRNRDLGDLAYQDAENIAGDVGVGGNLSYTGTLTGSTGVINIGSGQVYKDASGNVGIGTAAPSRKLTVYGSAGVPFINVNGYDTASWTSATLDFGGITAAQWNTVRIFASAAERLKVDATNVTVSTGNLVIGTAGKGIDFTTSGTFAVGGSEQMRLTSAGNLGIGTTAPGVLSGGFDVSSYKVVQTNGADGRAYNIQSAAGYCIDLKENTSGTTGRRVLQQTWNSDLYTWTVQSEVNGAPYSTPLVMTAAGNFGIGNTTPAAKLQVDQVGIQTTTTAITTTTETIVYSYPAATFRTAELMCQIVDSTNSQYHSAKFMIIHNSTDVWFNQTSVIHSHDELGTFTVNILSGNVRLLFTPTAATTKSVKVAATMLTS